MVYREILHGLGACGYVIGKVENEVCDMVYSLTLVMTMYSALLFSIVVILGEHHIYSRNPCFSKISPIIVKSN